MPSKSKAVKKTTSKTISKSPLVSVIMGSKSDYPTMSKAVDILKDFNIPHEVKVVSAHRTPERLFEFSKSAKKRGLKVIIAGAGGAAHLPGMVASLTTVPVFGVPVESKALKGMDSLLSIVQMPGGIPVGTLAIGEAGAKNAGLMAVAILAGFDDALSKKLESFRQKQTASIPENV